MAFNDIQDISYEAELMSRGRVTMELKAGPVSPFPLSLPLLSSTPLPHPLPPSSLW